MQLKESFPTLRVCKIYDGDYPWDIRVEKILSTLVEEKYEVHLVCRNLGRKPVYENLDNVHIHRLPFFKNDPVNATLSFPAPINPLWLLTAGRVIRENKIDLIIVRDLPLALAGILIGRKYGIPIVLDMAENYPAMVWDIWRFGGFKSVNLIARNPFIVHLIEAICVRCVNSILAVVEESKYRLLNRYGLDESKIHIVSNTPRISDYCWKGNNTGKHEDDGTLKLVFIGGLERSRNIEVVIRAMAINGIRHKLSLTIIGKGERDEEGRLRRLVDKLSLQGNVFLKGWIDHSYIGKYLSMSDIGVIPHAATMHTNTTVPNKLFDYMASGKPVLASDTEPVRRIVETEKCGLIYRSNSPEDCREKLLQLMDEKIRKGMGANGRRAIETKYNWEIDSKELRAALREL